MIRDARVQAVTLTGSERAGVPWAQAAGETLKKCVLELGGSDAFVVLEDADLKLAAEIGRQLPLSRTRARAASPPNASSWWTVAEEFLKEFRARAAALVTAIRGIRDHARRPWRASTCGTISTPRCRTPSRRREAAPGLQAASGQGRFYPASILDGVQPGMRAWDEELFGPVASVIRVKDEAEALKVANGTNFGLGGSVWTATRRAAKLLPGKCNPAAPS